MRLNCLIERSIVINYLGRYQMSKRWRRNGDKALSQSRHLLSNMSRKYVTQAAVTRIRDTFHTSVFALSRIFRKRNCPRRTLARFCATLKFVARDLIGTRYSTLYVHIYVFPYLGYTSSHVSADVDLPSFRSLPVSRSRSLRERGSPSSFRFKSQNGTLDWQVYFVSVVSIVRNDFHRAKICARHARVNADFLLASASESRINSQFQREILARESRLRFCERSGLTHTRTPATLSKTFAKASIEASQIMRIVDDLRAPRRAPLQYRANTRGILISGRDFCRVAQQRRISAVSFFFVFSFFFFSSRQPRKLIFSGISALSSQSLVIARVFPGVPVKAAFDYSLRSARERDRLLDAEDRKNQSRMSLFSRVAGMSRDFKCSVMQYVPIPSDTRARLLPAKLVRVPTTRRARLLRHNHFCTIAVA